MQAYALQTFLQKIGYDVAIIDYKKITHNNSYIRCFKSKSLKRIKQNIEEYHKELKFIPFRKKYLNLTKPFFKLDQLNHGTKDIDIFICGSDQIWNPYTALKYGNPYILPFIKDKRKKIAYAVSLGCTLYPATIFNEIKPYIQKFHYLSVREKTALDIFNQNGINSVSLMPDPVLLIDVTDLSHFYGKQDSSEDYIFFYTLQENQSLINSIRAHFSKNEKIKEAQSGKNALSVEKWVKTIAQSKFVVTNSFHGVVFSLLFHKSFIAIPVEGHLIGMNDRIYTLLDQFGLKDRIIEKYSELDDKCIFNKKIDWKNVDMIRNELKQKAYNFLMESITEA